MALGDHSKSSLVESTMEHLGIGYLKLHKVWWRLTSWLDPWLDSPLKAEWKDHLPSFTAVFPSPSSWPGAPETGRLRWRPQHPAAGQMLWCHPHPSGRQRRLPSEAASNGSVCWLWERQRAAALFSDSTVPIAIQIFPEECVWVEAWEETQIISMGTGRTPDSPQAQRPLVFLFLDY